MRKIYFVLFAVLFSTLLFAGGGGGQQYYYVRPTAYGNNNGTNWDNQENSSLKDAIEAYPNPFNPTTTICYYIPKDGRVSLKVYDVLGKEITTLVDDYKTIGNYSIKFNGENLSSGIYFYVLIHNKLTNIKKTILLK